MVTAAFEHPWPIALFSQKPKQTAFVTARKPGLNLFSAVSGPFRTGAPLPGQASYWRTFKGWYQN